MAGVSVRALRHYDEIGLLAPSERSAKGYRLYHRADLERLREILLLRELGLGLEAIRGVLGTPTLDRVSALRGHRELLRERQRRTASLIDAVERAIDAMENDTETEENMFEGFEALHESEYAQEAEERWGDTDAYRESTRRAKRYSREDWVRIRQEGEEPVTAFAALMRAGKLPTDVECMDAAERARLHIDRWFYPCSHAMHAKLAALYEVDERFAATYEERATGLRDFVVEAIRANQRRAASAG